MINILINAVNFLFDFVEFAIFIEIIMSWIPMAKGSRVIEIVHTITDPFMIPGRKIQEKVMPGMMLDFSPILALFIVYILRYVIISMLRLLI